MMVLNHVEVLVFAGLIMWGLILWAIANRVL